ncbi:MAG: hypothetical protein JRF55_07715 [Deltaproteobacteria bacterium]|nr:hypothetical protein [Deltaproteobacteria bacterium]
MAQPQTPRPASRPGAMTMEMQAVRTKYSGPKVLRIGLFRDKKIVEERIVRQRETISIGTAARSSSRASSSSNSSVTTTS